MEGLVERTSLMHAWKATSLLVLLLSAGPAAQAQLWIGPAAIEVRAEDQGRAAAGAEVRLEFLDMEPPAGPAPVKLDGRGRAVIGSLAEGHWRMEVSRQGAMTYRAEILVEAGGKPQVINAVQHNVPGAVTMMEVRLARARGGASVPRPAREIASAPMPAPAPAEEPAVEVRPIEPAPAPAAPPAPEPQPEPRQSVPVSEAEPLRPAPVLAPDPLPPAPAPATPSPSAPRPEPREEQPAPAPAPPPEPRPEPAPQRPAPPPPPAPAPRPAQPTPTPAPATPPPAQAAPVPSTPAPSVPQPALPVRRRSFQDRTCEECKAGESSMTVEVVVPPAPGATGCGSGLREALLRRDAALPPGCRMLRVELPEKVRYVGYRYEVQDGGTSTDCQAGKDCPAQGSRWPMDPLMFRDGAGRTTVSAAFENLSPDRERRALLTVYYKDAGSSNAPRPILPTRPRQERPPG